MKVELSRAFIRTYKKRFQHLPSIRAAFKERTRIFSDNPENVLLHDHKLRGDKRGHRAFSVTGDIRVVYIIVNEVAYFEDIGTHNQVY